MPSAQRSTYSASGQIVFAVSCRHLRDADDRFRICVDLLQAQLRLQSTGVHRHVLEEAAKQARVLPRLAGLVTPSGLVVNLANDWISRLITFLGDQPRKEG